MLRAAGSRLERWRGARACIGRSLRQPRAKPGGMSGMWRHRAEGGEVNETRRKAWETRRAKYGPRGNNGSYARPATGQCARCAAMEALIIRLHVEGALSEGQAAKATGLHRIRVRKLADEY